MIGRLTGRISECSPDRVLLDVGGVGYELRIPLSTFYVLSAASPNGVVSLHVHTHVREDALQLFGFSKADERALFELLIAISGVGPRIALAVLSGIGPDELREAIVRRDRERLQKIPGVGRKTAERVLLELRDRLGVDESIAAAGSGAQGGGAPAAGSSVERDAVSALVNLGYSQAIAERAVGRAARGETVGEGDLEGLLKAALRALST